MSKILITGASGFFGANLARNLSTTKDEVNIFIRKTSNLWRINSIIKNLNAHFVDLSDDEETYNKIKEIKPDIVFHCATYGISHSQNDLKILVQTNVINSIKLMESCVKYNDLERFVNIGSSLEYGPKANAIKETDNVEPKTLYGITKTAQTHFASYFKNQKNLPVVTLRVFNTYGKYQEAGHLISDIMIALVAKKSLTLSASTAKRDFIYIDDVVDALIKAGKQPEVEGEIFNIGVGKEFLAEEIIDIVQRVTHTNRKISFNNKNQCEFDKREIGCFANVEKAKKLLNWEQNYSIEQGLKKTYDWYDENIDSLPFKLN